MNLSKDISRFQHEPNPRGEHQMGQQITGSDSEFWAMIRERQLEATVPWDEANARLLEVE